MCQYTSHVMFALRLSGVTLKQNKPQPNELIKEQASPLCFENPVKASAVKLSLHPNWKSLTSKLKQPKKLSPKHPASSARLINVKNTNKRLPEIPPNMLDIFVFVGEKK